METNNDFAGNGDERAKPPLRSPNRVRARTSSRRKAGAETSVATPTIRTLSPQSLKQAITQSTSRVSAPASGDHQGSDPHAFRVAGPIESGGECHLQIDAQLDRALSSVIDQIREQWRRRQMWHRAEKSLTLQAKSMCRRLLAGDKKEAEVLYKSVLNGQEHSLATVALLAMQPLLQARDGIEVARLQVEKRLLALAKELPVAAWIEGVRGVGLLSLAGIVGEAGDIGAYGNPAKLWKRMGLAVIGGERQRKKEGDAGILHGYNPARRSLMWTIGDCIIRAGGPLKELYNQRKEYEAPRVATKMHAHNRAKRYIEKRLLRDLWRAWRDASSAKPSNMISHPSESMQEAA